MDLQLAARGFERTNPGPAHDQPGLARLGEGSLDATIDNQRLMETTIDKTVAKIIARLPR